MDHEDPTLDVEAALRDEEELAALAELGAAWTAPEEEPSATPPGDAAATPGEPGSDAEKAPSGPPQKGRKERGHYVYGVTHARLRERGLSLGLQPPEAAARECVVWGVIVAALRTEIFTSGPRASALWMSPVCVVASGRGGGRGPASAPAGGVFWGSRPPGTRPPGDCRANNPPTIPRNNPPKAY